MFEAVDAADAATLESLARILRRPGWLRLPLLLTVRGALQGPVAELINLAQQGHADAGIFEIGGNIPPGEVAAPFAWTALPPDIVGRLAATTAGVCYDLGDLDSLQQALGELTEASRRLLEVHEPVLAARLLNDQAAIYVRLGDPVRATHLLERLRELFEGRLRTNAEDTVALEELAETHHLLARLPMHAPIRPGREADAFAMSMEHAQVAERVYQRLGERQELARVWETVGRLELQRGHQAVAQQRLSAALASQQQLGDVIGAARSAAALAELYKMTRRLADALALLADSITLNFEKGSPLGLAVNWRAVGALAEAAAQTHGPGAENLQGGVEEVERRLLQAESVLGRMELPAEARA
jgi:tetratricopeptide (TPR) repeat protein